MRWYRIWAFLGGRFAYLKIGRYEEGPCEWSTLVAEKILEPKRRPGVGRFRARSQSWVSSL
jgi:hypothetical protein